MVKKTSYLPKENQFKIEGMEFSVTSSVTNPVTKPGNIQPKPNYLVEQIIIIILLLLVIGLALLSAYGYLVKEPTVTPEEMERKALINFVNENPKDDKARLALAYSYQKVKDYEKAQQQYLDVLKREPKEISALYNLGMISKDMKNYQRAVTYFKQVLAIKKLHILGSLGLGEVYLLQRNYPAAIKIADDVLKVQGHLAEPRIIKAQALEKLGNNPGALKEYLEVLKYVPHHEEAQKSIKRLQLGGQ